MKILRKILIILVISLFIGHYSFNIVNATSNDSKLIDVLESYWQWWLNSPEDNPDNDPKCSIHLNKNFSIAFLQNPFETGDNSYDCTEDPIPYGYLIFFPLITSFCSQGDIGLLDKGYYEIMNCALNLDRGTIQGKILVNDKEIVNVFIDNSNGIDMQNNKKVVTNPPQSQYYREIFSEEFADILATNKTIFPNNWEKDEHKRNPVYYNGVVHCDCIIINTTELSTGHHTLQYIISAKAKPPSPNFIADQWDFTSNTNYQLLIQ